MTTTTLITGPNRGIGRGILATILARPHNTVIAAVRDPQAAVSQGLNHLSKGSGSSLHIVKIDLTVPTDPAAAVQTLEAAGSQPSILSLPTPPLPIPLAFEPLLRKAQNQNPKFIALSSSLGSISLAPSMPGPWFCYGITKAALNYMVRRVHVENDWLTALALQPGWVQTDMGNFAAKCVGMESAPMTLEDSVAGCMTVIDAASREKYAGEFVSGELKTGQW